MSLVDQINGLATRVASEFRKAAPSGPTMTYSGGALTRIDYANGDYKTFTYSSGRLSQIDHVLPGRTVRKTFNYSGETLTSITEAEI